MRHYKTPVFQHRHYAAIAALLAVHKDQLPKDVILNFAVMFGNDNPRFQTSRFLAAAAGQPSNGRDRR